MTALRQFDELQKLQLGEGATNGLDGQSEEIAAVGSRAPHRRTVERNCAKEVLVERFVLKTEGCAGTGEIVWGSLR
jgi:hypothetical protein